MRLWLHIVAILLCGSAIAGPGGKGSGNGTRLYFGPAYGFYSLNKRHAIDPASRASVCVGLLREWRLDREYKSFILFGAEYFLHGVGFRSYYFVPGAIKLYDGTFGYNYNWWIQELQLPFQFKYLFQRADNKLFSPYFALGFQLRALLNDQLEVRDASGRVKKDFPGVRFRHPLFSDKLNAGVHVSLGWQKNAISSSRGAYYIEIDGRYGFSQYYFERDYAASSLYVNSMHLVLKLGLRF